MSIKLLWIKILNILPITILTNVEMKVIERFFNKIEGLKEFLVFRKLIIICKWLQI